MVNKRGIELLPSQLVKIILAITAVLLAIILIVILINAFFVTHTDELQAKATLDNIYERINFLQPSEASSIEIYLPKGWTVVFFKNDTRIYNRFSKPSSFTFKNTLCICKKKCKPDICKEIKKPVFYQDKPFFLQIKDFKKFYVGFTGEFFVLKEQVFNVDDQHASSTTIVDGIQIPQVDGLHEIQITRVDESWNDLGNFNITAYYTAYEKDFSSWCSPTKGSCFKSENEIRSFYGASVYTCLDERRGGFCCIKERDMGFYESVMCEGSGLGVNREIYKSEKIKQTKEASEIISAPNCEFGTTALGTDTMIGRTIAVDSSVIPYRSYVYLEFDCSTSEFCKDFCDTFNRRVYIAEDTGRAIKGNHIDLYVGVSKKRIDEAKRCLVGSQPTAKVKLAPVLIELSALKKWDEKIVQSTTLV